QREEPLWLSNYLLRKMYKIKIKEIMINPILVVLTLQDWHDGRYKGN
ncbi:unnamed protein product, partial [marine sediment metagenome]